jgi:hypothetical protein
MDDEDMNRKVLEFKRPPAVAPADPFWPDLAAPYRAAGKPSDADIPRLLVVMGKEGFQPGGTAFHTLPYRLIDEGGLGYDDDGEWFFFLFGCARPVRLLARGRNLRRICDAIARHRMPWIRVADRDFRPCDGLDDDVPIFTHIEVEEK